MRALLSVYDKTGLGAFAKELQELGVELYSTGKTYESLKDEGVAVSTVSELTGEPDIVGGRVKTVHSTIHAALLANRYDSEHAATLEQLGVKPIDLVVVNLYPFVKTISEGPIESAE